MKVAPQVADLAGALRHLLLPPAVGHRAQQCDQRGGRGDQHLLLHALLDQAGHLLERGAEEGLAGQEHHHELGRRGELRPVGLLAQLRHVVAHVPAVDRRAARAAGRRRRPRPRSGRPRAAPSRRPRRPCRPAASRSGPGAACRRRSRAVDCSVKSQWASIPAISQTRRSWISPQRPRVCGERSAVTRLAVSFRSRSCVSATERTCCVRLPWTRARARSSCSSSPRTLSSPSAIGFTSCSIARWRLSRLLAAGHVVLAELCLWRAGGRTGWNRAAPSPTATRTSPPCRAAPRARSSRARA